MKFLLIVLFATAASVTSQAVDTPPDSPNPRPQRCCFPDQMQYAMREHVFTDSAGHKMLSGVEGLVAVDYKRHMMAILEVIKPLKGDVSHMKIVMDFAKGEMFLATVEGKTCHRMPTTRAMGAQCLPRDAKYTGSIRLGLGASSLTTHGWEFRMLDNITQTDEHIHLMAAYTDRRTCVPVVEHAYGKQWGMDIAFAVAAFDMEPKIRDPKIFDVPDFCKKDADGPHVPPLEKTTSMADMPEMGPLQKYMMQRISRQ